MKFAVLVLVVFAVACGESVPEGAAPISASVLAMTTESWSDQGLPEAKCSAPMWVKVSFDEYAAACPAPSCADPRVSAGAPCTQACTHFMSGGVSVGFWAGQAPQWPGYTVPLTEAEAQAHETWHVWSDCTTGDMDEDHHNAAVWKDAAADMHSLVSTPS